MECCLLLAARCSCLLEEGGGTQLITKNHSLRHRVWPCHNCTLLHSCRLFPHKCGAPRVAHAVHPLIVLTVAACSLSSSPPPPRLLASSLLSLPFKQQEEDRSGVSDRQQRRFDGGVRATTAVAHSLTAVTHWYTALPCIFCGLCLCALACRHATVL